MMGNPVVKGIATLGINLRDSLVNW